MSESDSTSIPYGYCHCGCGELAPIAKKTSTRDGIRKGEPRKFVHSHMLAAIRIPKLGTHKACQICGASFYVPRARPNTCYCSRKCKGIASRKPRICPICESEFLRGGTGKYCCKPCAAKGRKTGEMRPCGICGEPVYITKSRLGKDQYFCSVEHANKWQGRNKTQHTCKTCGNEFRWSPSRSKVDHQILYCSLLCRDADPQRRERLLQMTAMQQLGRQTEPERIGYTLLDSLPIDYTPQHVIGGKFCVDAFIPDPGVVVQFDGDYWHGHPERFPYPDARQQRRMKLDSSQDAYMKACGYSVIRIWETDLKHNLESVSARLRQLLVH